jgi:prevent-host-death family protein
LAKEIIGAEANTRDPDDLPPDESTIWVSMTNTLVIMSSLTIDELESMAGTHSTRSASDVEANWRAIVKEARENDVIVTNSDRPEAVVISAERYASLLAKDPLRRLREEFDRELAVLQAPGAEEKLREIFDATPEEIARAANAAVSRV